MTKTNQKSKPFGSGLLVGVLLAIVACRIAVALPTVVLVFLLIFAAVGPCRVYFKNAVSFAKAMLQAPILGLMALWDRVSDRIGRFFKIGAQIWNMDSREFEEKFSGSSDEPSPDAPHNEAPAMQFIPEQLCKRELSPEEAQSQAEAWWNSKDEEDGSTGESRLMDLLSCIANEDPSIHTCLLNDHEELRLPTEALVLSKLIEIFRENGIAADFTADEQVIVSWGQDSNGVEVGMA